MINVGNHRSWPHRAAEVRSFGPTRRQVLCLLGCVAAGIVLSSAATGATGAADVAGRLAILAAATIVLVPWLTHQGLTLDRDGVLVRHTPFRSTRLVWGEVSAVEQRHRGVYSRHLVLRTPHGAVTPPFPSSSLLDPDQAFDDKFDVVQAWWSAYHLPPR